VLPLPDNAEVSFLRQPVFPSEDGDPKKDKRQAYKLVLKVRQQCEYPCVMVADLECRLSRTTPDSPSGAVQTHAPNSFTLWWLVKSRVPGKPPKVQHFTYVGEDCIEVFLKKVQSVASQLRKMIKDAVPLDPASVPATHEHAKHCHICRNVLHAGFDAGTLTPAQERVYDLHRARFKCPDGTPLEPTPASIAELIEAGADAT
jgi:hypothetical protein